MAKKKTKTKRKSKSLNKSKKKAKTIRNSKSLNNIKKKIINKRNKTSAEDELVIKVPRHWAKKAYTNKNSYQKNIITLLKKMKTSGEKKEKE